MPHLSPMNWMFMFLIFWFITFLLTFYLWWNKEMPVKPMLNPFNMMMTPLPW